MSKIDARTTLTLNGREYVLHCTLDKCLEISRRFEGFGKLTQAFIDENVAVIADLVYVGLARDDQGKTSPKKIAGDILRHGAGLAANAVYPYVSLCRNGGKAPEVVEDGEIDEDRAIGHVEDAEAEDEGNDSHVS